MSADSTHRTGRRKMNCITTNKDFTTESSTLTFILAPFDTTWRAGLGWSKAHWNIHPLLSQPTSGSTTRLSHHPGKGGDHTPPDALCCRKASSWARHSANQQQRQCILLVLIEGDLVTDHGCQCKSGELDKLHLEKKRGGVSKGSPALGYSVLWHWTRVALLTSVELLWFTWR